MKHLIFLVMFILSNVTNAQTDYNKAMGSALQLMSDGSMNKAEGMFERISQAETDKWLPHYYIAQINSILSWNEKDKSKVSAQLEKAQKHLDVAMKLSPENPELLVMQAQVLTNWVVYDAQTFGMKYSNKINDLYTQASKIDPNNPRAVASKAEWDMGSARYFGKDTSPYCSELQRSLELFATFKPESPISPQWGEKRTKEVINQCK